MLLYAVILYYTYVVCWRGRQRDRILGKTLPPRESICHYCESQQMQQGYIFDYDVSNVA